MPLIGQRTPESVGACNSSVVIPPPEYPKLHTVTIACLDYAGLARAQARQGQHLGRDALSGREFTQFCRAGALRPMFLLARRWNPNCPLIKRMGRANQICALNLTQTATVAVEQAERARAALKRRLAEAVEYLEKLEQQRIALQNPGFGRAVEERIIWRELLELELQMVDEQINRMTQSGSEGLSWVQK